MRRILVPLFLLLALVVPAVGDWDATKPADSSAALTADVRANWAAIALTVGEANLVADPAFRMWYAADTLSHWSATGTLDRTGAGETDTTAGVAGSWAASLTGSGGNGYLFQDILTTTGYPIVAAQLDGTEASCGSWVKTSTATVGRIYINDGTATTNSSYHTGGGAWEWLTVTHTFDASATFFRIVATTTDGVETYFSGVTCVLGPIPPSQYHPAPIRWERNLACFLSGNVAATSDQCRYYVPRPATVRAVYLDARTGPAGAALIVDVNQYMAGPAWTSMYSTRPTIADGARIGVAIPDGTFERKHLIPEVNSTIAAGEVISFDVDQIGSGTAGANLSIYVDTVVYDPPFAQYNLWTEWK